MKRLEDFDKNFVVKKVEEKDGLEFFDIESAPFAIYGVFKEGERFVRIPEDKAKNISEAIYEMRANTAGGRVRFKTDSAVVAIEAELNNIFQMPHFAFTGSHGLDLYEKSDGITKYAGTFVLPVDVKDKYSSSVNLGAKKLRELTINMPLYGGLNKLYVGIEKGAVLEAAQDYEIEKPIVYYGSSITQGGCASRAGMAYQSIISRHINCDHINLGFSGSAKGEQEMTDYIKSLDMSLFVMDYDHNAPDVAHLEATHEKMFKDIREAHSELPIIMMSRPSYYLNEEEVQRRDIIKKTYENAVSSGDKNVYFIDGSTIMSDFIKSEGTVDGCHPTDAGFICMAQALIPVIKKALNI